MFVLVPGVLYRCFREEDGPLREVDTVPRMEGSHTYNRY